MRQHSDLFAIPDFAAGAMENWGLITYRETAILYDPESSSSSSKQRVAVVISHELAHQVIVVLFVLAKICVLSPILLLGHCVCQSEAEGCCDSGP